MSKPVEELRLTDADVDRIELALEAMVPEAITEVHSQCPGCGRDQVLPLDPYWALEQLPSSLREQVHTIASAYHWSEADILALPRARRHDYLALIDANWTEQVG